MHVHGNPFDPMIQMNYLSAVAKAEAANEAAQTRKKLMNAASSLNSEAAGDFVVSLAQDRDRNRQEQRPREDSDQIGKPEEAAPAPATIDETFSDYA